MEKIINGEGHDRGPGLAGLRGHHGDMTCWEMTALNLSATAVSSGRFWNDFSVGQTDRSKGFERIHAKEGLVS